MEQHGKMIKLLENALRCFDRFVAQFAFTAHSAAVSSGRPGLLTRSMIGAWPPPSAATPATR
jgi:hypothetical protein